MNSQSIAVVWIVLVLLSILFGALYSRTRNRVFFVAEVGLLLVLTFFVYSPTRSRESGIGLGITIIIGFTVLIGYLVGFFGVYVIKSKRGTLKEDEKFSFKKFNDQIIKRHHESDEETSD